MSGSSASHSPTVVPPATSPVAATDADLASSLRVSVMRLARRLRLERGDDDLSMSQLAVLGTLYRRGELTIGELAAAERVKPPSMTRTVDCLTAAGLVERRPHESDGRQVLVAITALAREVIADDRQRRDAWLAQRLAELDPEDRALMQRVAPVLAAMADA